MWIFNFLLSFLKFQVKHFFIQITHHPRFFTNCLPHTISLGYLSSNGLIVTCFCLFIPMTLTSSCVIVLCKSIFWRFISAMLLRRASIVSSSFLLFSVFFNSLKFSLYLEDAFRQLTQSSSLVSKPWGELLVIIDPSLCNNWRRC